MTQHNSLFALLAWAGAGAIALACSAQNAGKAPNGTPGAGGSPGASGSDGQSGSVGVGGSDSSGAPGFSGAVGVGGAVGAGGAVTAGAAGITGGAGGPAIVQKLCADKVTAQSTQIATFENYDGLTPASSYSFQFGGATAGTLGVYAGVYSYGDGSAVPTLSILAGHTGNYGLTESVTMTSVWGQGMGVYLLTPNFLPGCVNASAYRGISFWVRGVVPTGTFGFNLAMESTTPPDANPAGGGTCTGAPMTGCVSPTLNNLPITLDWTQVQVLWTDLTPGVNGTQTVIPNGDLITGLGFSTGLQFVGGPVIDPVTMLPTTYVPVPGDISFSIDDIEFIP